VAIVGGSGSGKSTTVHAIVRLLARNGRITGGSLTFEGRDLRALRERELEAIRGRSIGFVPQDPMQSLDPVQRIGKQVAESLRIHGLADTRTANDLVVEALTRCGIDRPEFRARQYPHELSGGMRQRVLIAIATSCTPHLVIADEPTSALDVTIQRGILDDLVRLNEESNVAMLLVTHDIGVAAMWSERIIVMHDGHIVEFGTPDTILHDPTAPYTRELVAAIPGRRVSARARAAATSVALPSEHTVNAAPTQDRPSQSDVLLSLRDVTKHFAGPKGQRVTAVDGVSIEVRRGETLALVGESGSGKSTLARIAMRLEIPDEGSVLFDGHDLGQLPGSELRRLRRRFQMVYQNPFGSIDPRFSVDRAIIEPLRIQGIGNGPSRTRRAAEMRDRVALPKSSGRRRIGELSGGQRQRVAIARALAVEPDLLVCDEAVSALDVLVQEQILELLADLQREMGLAYLFISHDLAVVREVAQRVAVMHRGRIVEEADVDVLFSDPASAYTKELVAAIPIDGVALRALPSESSLTGNFAVSSATSSSQIQQR
jgi:peptide/nickel transport system ATP-binding protein